MNSEWSLDVLYRGYDDVNFKKDMEALEKSISELALSYEKAAKMENREGLLTIIDAMETSNILLSKLYNYISLRESVNTTDKETSGYVQAILKLYSSLSVESSRFDKYVATIDNIDECIASDDKLKAYEFLLKKTKENSKYSLSGEVEDVIAKLNLSAGSAWASLQQYLTSTLKVDYKGEEVTLSAIRNVAYSQDAKERKEAYEAEIASYDKVKDAVAFSLNNIKSQVNTIAELRGYESPLDMTLKKSGMKRETLDAMLLAMKEYMPKFHEYLRAKAKILGHKNGLPFYDLFAPLGVNNKKFTVEQARDYLLELFGSFSEDLKDMATEAFDNAWIDFYPRSGKVGGAFCCNLPLVKQSRVLTNFEGSLSDVVTIAHELGHAYHGKHIEGHLPLNLDYSMPVAETASTFNENIVMNAAIETATGKEKMVLIESQLQDVTQIICDIYSRFLFESQVFEKRKTTFLFANDLEQIMIDAQKEAYGDGLDSDYLHPYMWINKGHYYSENLSFYNFPYAFGGLFAKGLYEQYREEKEAFVPKYQKLLEATTVNDVEDVAMMASIDMTKPDFWRKSLSSYADLVDEFIRLSEEYSI